VGDAFAFVALPLLVLEVGGTVTAMGNVTAVACATQIAMSLVAGIVVDRVDRRTLMILTDVARLALYAALPVAAHFGAASLGLVYVVAGLGAALGNLFIVAHVTAVKNIVSKEDLAGANSRLQATQALAFAVGPVLAGAVCARFGAPMAIAVDAASFGVSAASLVFVRLRSAPEPEVAMGARRPASGGAADLFTGLRYLAKEPVLRALMSLQVFVGALACAGLSAAVIDLFVFRLRHDLGQSSTVVGMCLGGAALGALGGAILSPRVRRRFHSAGCILGGTGLQAVGLTAAGLLPGTFAILLGATCWATGLTVRAVVNVSLRQERTPDALLGRVMAAATTLVIAAATFGAVLVTRLAALLGADHALALTGAALGVVVLAGTLTPLAKLRDAPAV
jgi:MFS family permease